MQFLAGNKELMRFSSVLGKKVSILKKILLSVFAISAVLALVVGATVAQFSDTETSNGNTFTSGSLDLDVDGNNGTNTVKFTVTNFRPGNQPIGVWHLNNVGTLAGYLDLENISVTSEENSCLEPEIEAGDPTCGDPNQGEVASIVGLDMFFDVNCNGWFGAEDTKFYSGNAAGVASSYDTSYPIPAAGSACVTAQINWWSSTDDNKAQGDDMTMDMTFELGQTTAQ